jgi:hypothetical protein
MEQIKIGKKSSEKEKEKVITHKYTMLNTEEIKGKQDSELMMIDPNKTASLQVIGMVDKLMMEREKIEKWRVYSEIQ